MIEKEIKGTHANESVQTLYYISKCTLPKGTANWFYSYVFEKNHSLAEFALFIKLI